MRLSKALEHDRYALVALLLLMLVNLTAVLTFPGGYDADDPILILKTFGAIWLFGFFIRVAYPDMRFIYYFEAMTLSTALGIQTALATAAIAPLGGAYVDPLLEKMDSILVPFISWPELVRWLARHPDLFRAMNYVYTSINYQGPALFLLMVGLGWVRQVKVLIAAGAISGIIGLSIFALMPAQGAYIHYGIAQADVPPLMVPLPFEFPVVLEALRSGTIEKLSMEAVSGLISFPSFHAAGATMLAMGWMQFRYLRVPMVALNVGIALTAIPIGSHYFSDILAGVLLGCFSMRLARHLIEKADRPEELLSTPPVSGITASR